MRIASAIKFTKVVCTAKTPRIFANTSPTTSENEPTRRVRFKLMCRVRSPIPTTQEGCRVHEKTTLSDQAILQGLNANPQIKNRIASLLAVVQDASGDLKLADAAEMRLIEEIRCMGQEAMQAWADKQVQACEQEVRLSGQAHCDGKKNSPGTPPLVTSV